MCPGRAGDRPVLVNDSSKARELLGWTPKFPELDRQIMHAWSWFRDKMPNIQSNWTHKAPQPSDQRASKWFDGAPERPLRGTLGLASSAVNWPSCCT
jgi:hypothetical protein